MRNSGQGGFGMPGNFEALARQYWGAWGDAMRNAAPGAAAMGAGNPWQDAFDGWSRLAAQGGNAGADDVLGRFNNQARHWFGQMQQVAAQFAGRDAGAADVANAWKRMLESSGTNPFLGMLQDMRGPGLQGFEQWSAQAAPFLESMRGEALSWLRVPAFGVMREHQERWQHLAQAQAELQQRTDAYNALMQQATQDAYAIFESKLAEREEPGRQIESARALFDLWIDAAEEAYAKIALSPEFRQAYGQLVDAQMRVRAGVQREVEQASAAFGMPTRTELDGAHRKIVELERQLRRLRDAVAGHASKPAMAPGTRAASSPPPRQPAAAKPASGASTRTRKAPKRAAPAKAAPAAKKAKPARAPVRNKRSPAFAMPDAPMPVAPMAMKGKR